MNTGIDFLFFLLLTAAGLPALLSHVCSYTTGLINSYCWNKWWTFRASRRRAPGEAARFLLVNLAALAAAGGVLLAGRDVCGLPEALAKACALPVSLTINFLGNRLWVFPARSAGPPPGGTA
jgi:putative flippase GtrA